MPELRYNLITTEWVILATERARRPKDFRIEKPASVPLLPRVEACPFCPGNEHLTPGELYRIGDDGHWQVRVVPNKFSALNSEGKKWRSVRGTHMSLSGVGLHDVIIETPRHDLTLALLPDAQVEKVLTAYRARYRQMTRDDRVEMVVLFKNHGEGAGTSLAHPHSQAIAIPLVPAQVRARMDEMKKYFDIHGSCILCDMVGEEEREGARMVEATDAFVAFIPFAALSPFHLWVFPRRHGSCFSLIQDAELADLAGLLRRVLSRIHFGLGNPDYNYVIRSAPVREQELPYFHWYLSIVPRVTKAAGFELGSGMYINTSLPEESARFLRDTPPTPPA